MGGWRTEFWEDLFELLAEHTKEGRWIILFDEISWMGSLDPTFLGQLKNAWDLKFSPNNKLILFLYGSVSTWIEENIIKSTGFFGRISRYMTFEELSLPECNQFLNTLGFPGPVHEKLKILSVTGGIPWYLEQIAPRLNADENIKHFCFHKEGLLVHEFNLIFHDLFGKQSELYKQIISILSQGPIEFSEICDPLSYEKGGCCESIS